jgi:hypothetical protein
VARSSAVNGSSTRSTCGAVQVTDPRVTADGLLGHERDEHNPSTPRLTQSSRSPLAWNVDRPVRGRAVDVDGPECVDAEAIHDLYGVACASETGQTSASLPGSLTGIGGRVEPIGACRRDPRKMNRMTLGTVLWALSLATNGYRGRPTDATTGWIRNSTPSIQELPMSTTDVRVEDGHGLPAGQVSSHRDRSDEWATASRTMCAAWTSVSS